MYYFIIEVMENGVFKNYDVKVWVKFWEGYKEFELFLLFVFLYYDLVVDFDVKLGVYDVFLYVCFGFNVFDFLIILGIYVFLLFF